MGELPEPDLPFLPGQPPAFSSPALVFQGTRVLAFGI